MSDLIIAPILFGFALGFSQEMAKDLRRWLRSRRLANPMGPTRDRDWRRSFNHENTNRPSGPPPLKLRRRDDGYQPRSQGGTPNPPPSDP